MGQGGDLAKAAREYAAAYQAHYEEGDLRGALALYRSLMDAHPGTAEASYSKTQIQNIVMSVVPEKELFDAHVDLAAAHLGPVDQPT